MMTVKLGQNIKAIKARQSVNRDEVPFCITLTLRPLKSIVIVLIKTLKNKKMGF